MIAMEFERSKFISLIRFFCCRLTLGSSLSLRLYLFTWKKKWTNRYGCWIDACWCRGRYAESDSSSAFRIKLDLKIDLRFWGKGKNGVLVGKPFEAARYLKVPVSFRARSRIFKITENLAHYRAHPSSQTSPFCFVNWYIYCFIFKTVEALRLNTNTTNLKRLSEPCSLS